MKGASWSHRSGVGLLSLLAAAVLSGCGGDTNTVYRDNPVDLPYVEDGSGAESFTANIIAPPEGVDEWFAPASPPVVSGVTAREPDPTVISDFHRYTVNRDLTLTMGRLNHTRHERIISAEFTLGDSLSLVPVTRSRGQFSFERTTASANHAIDKGQNLILAVNADPYSMTQGWNAGLIKKNGVTYTGFSDRNEDLIVVYQNGQADILTDVPTFTLNLYQDGKAMGELGAVHYFDKASQINTSFTRGTGSAELYLAESYRAPWIWPAARRR